MIRQIGIALGPFSRWRRRNTPASAPSSAKPRKLRDTAVRTALVIATIPLMGQGTTPAAGTPCTNLAALTIPTVTVKSANLVPAGPF